MSHSRVIILAAGEGKRMGADVPKPLVEVAGRPMVEHLLESVRETGVDERPILVVAPHSVEAFSEVCRDQSCEYVVQIEQLGTGDAVKAAREASNGAETVIVLYGDHPFVSSEILSELHEMHTGGDALVSMITTKVPNFEKDHATFKTWGRILRDDVGHVVGIREAKDCTEEELEIKEVNPALYAFNAAWLWDRLPELSDKNANKEYYLTDLIEMGIEEAGEIVTTQADPMEVVGVNTPEDLAMAEKLYG